MAKGKGMTIWWFSRGYGTRLESAELPKRHYVKNMVNNPLQVLWIRLITLMGSRMRIRILILSHASPDPVLDFSFQITAQTLEKMLK
jgi:hypothetical protein